MLIRRRITPAAAAIAVTLAIGAITMLWPDAPDEWEAVELDEQVRWTPLSTDAGEPCPVVGVRAGTVAARRALDSTVYPGNPAAAARHTRDGAMLRTRLDARSRNLKLHPSAAVSQQPGWMLPLWLMDAMAEAHGPLPRPPHRPLPGSTPPRTYCYTAVSGDICRAEAFSLWTDRVAAACTHWQVFSDHDAPPHITKIFDGPDDWHRSWASQQWDAVSAAWEHAGSAYPDEPPFDWVIKLDSDTVIRPATFWMLFDGHDPAAPLVLSMTDTACELSQQSPAFTDAWFVAVSRGAGARIFSRPADAGTASVVSASVVTGCPHLLSGHDVASTIAGVARVQETGPDTLCLDVHGIRIVAPLDPDGYSLILVDPLAFFDHRNADGVPDIVLWLWSGVGGCLPPPEWADTGDEEMVGGASTHGLWCFSPSVAILHAVKVSEPDSLALLRKLTALGL
eukprot:m.293922 g.293922  ORF g.293922 m.293922 type:complete len:452 (-) comp27150_c0_seq1:300-1655(-)